jgi:hypothetical protein
MREGRRRERCLLLAGDWLGVPAARSRHQAVQVRQARRERRDWIFTVVPWPAVIVCFPSTSCRRLGRPGREVRAAGFRQLLRGAWSGCRGYAGERRSFWPDQPLRAPAGRCAGAGSRRSAGRCRGGRPARPELPAGTASERWSSSSGRGPSRSPGTRTARPGAGDDLYPGPGRPRRARPAGRSRSHRHPGTGNRALGLTEMWITDPDGTRIVLVEVPAGHPLRRDPRLASPPR